MRRASLRFPVSSLGACVLYATGCGSSAPAEPQLVSLPPAASQVGAAQPAPRAGAPLPLSLRAMPPTLALDGALDEWQLDPAQPGVAVGVDAKRVVVALSTGASERSVISLSLATPAPALPSIGWSQRGGTTHELTDETCEFEQIPLVEGQWDNGERHPPEVRQACLAVLARYEQQRDAYRERFVRRLRIEGESVVLVDVRGTRAPIPGATVKARGSSAEIELPLSALPDLDEAPLSQLLGVAVLGELPEPLRAAPLKAHPSYGEPPTLAEGWARLELDAPVGFGPLPELLAAAMAEPSSVMNGGLMAQRSYAPAKPEAILVVSVPDVAVAQSGPAPSRPGAIGGASAPDRPALAFEEQPLATPVETFGRVSIVLSLGSIATLIDGKLVATSDASAPDATHRRGSDLHLFHFSPGGFDWMLGFSPPTWRALAVKPSGAVEEVADETTDFPGMYDAWDDAPTTFHNRDWTGFGIQGKRKGKPKIVAWKWDASQGRYLVSVTPPQTWP